MKTSLKWSNEHYEIRTHKTSNFQTILDLIKNDHYEIQRKELPFFAEIFETLKLNQNSTNIEGELTVDDVLDRIKVHEHSRILFSDVLKTEIEFAATNFSFLKNHQEGKLMSLSFDTLEQMLHNSELKRNNQNELLEFINHLYANDTQYSKLYDNYILMLIHQVSKSFFPFFTLKTSILVYGIQFSTRLKQTIEKPNYDLDRYIIPMLNIPYQNKEFDDVFNSDG